MSRLLLIPSSSPRPGPDWWKVDDISHLPSDRSWACVTVGFINEEVNEPINCLCLSSQISPGGGFQLNSSILQSGQSRQPSPGLAWFVYSALNTEIWYFDFWHFNIFNGIFDSLSVCVCVVTYLHFYSKIFVSTVWGDRCTNLNLGNLLMKSQQLAVLC